MVSDFHKKRNSGFPIKRFLFQAGAMFFAVCIVALVIKDFKIYKQKESLAEKINAYEKKIEEIKKNSQELKDKIDNADNAEYLEKIAYEQGMVKAGEKEVVFLLPEQKEKIVTENKKSFWDNFAGWFSGPLNWIKSRF